MCKHKAIIVFSDGEAWDTIDGQTICIITEEEYQDLCEGRTSVAHLITTVEIDLVRRDP